VLWLPQRFNHEARVAWQVNDWVAPAPTMQNEELGLKK
jgi:hypothetical protein